MKRAFTLIELLVVISMILLIAGALTVSVGKARLRARIAKATQETRELTNAILAYEQFAKGRSLSSRVTGGSWRECSEGAMGMILGRESGESGEQIPVLFNASIRGGMIVDPWGRPYRYMIEKTDGLGNTIQMPQTAAVLPNYNRLTDSERGAK